MIHIEDVLLHAISRTGKRYVFGAEADGKPDPKTIDCSELVQWSLQQAGMPNAPDGAANQHAWCERAGMLIPVERALKTRGALMFPFPDVHHVVFSLGDGTTMEAKGKAYGVGVFSAKGRFQRAALIPGVDYTPRGQKPPPEPPKPAAKPAPLHPWPGHPTARGSKDKVTVEVIQRAVRVKVDGDYGPKTAAAVRAFQKVHKLAQSGTVDRATWRALFGS